MVFRRAKLEMYLPEEYVDVVRQSLGEMGVGVVGDYEFCSSAYPVTGTWKPKAAADPYEGESGVLSKGSEWKLEMVCPMEDVPSALEAVRELHPYEEPVVHVVPLIDNISESMV